MDEPKSFIIELGAESFKFGFSSDKNPGIISNKIGRLDPKWCGEVERCMRWKYPNMKEIRIGDEYNRWHRVTQPIPEETGYRWDDMGDILSYIFSNTSHSNFSECPVLLCDFPWNTRLDRINLINKIFFNCDTPAVCFWDQAALSLYSTGNLTGMASSSGEKCTYAAPIFEGYTLKDNIYRNNIAGSFISNHLSESLGLSLDEKQSLKDIKENHCYVALDFERETWKYKPTCNI